MRDGNPGSEPPRRSGTDRAVAEYGGGSNGNGARRQADAPDTGWVIETTVSPFHCLYQDALHFHTQSHLRLSRSESEASRLARAALMLYVASAEALVHQAAVELGRPDLVELFADPTHPTPTAEAWRLLPSIVASGPCGAYDPEVAPWPQFSELLSLQSSWMYPGPAPERKAYYRSPRREAEYEPLEPHQVPHGLTLFADRLLYPRTGLPRDPYALRPRHLDTARSVLDSAIEALDRRLGGTLTRDQRHRKEPVRVVYPPQAPSR